MENQRYTSVEGVLYNKVMDELIAYPGGRQEGAVLGSVTSVGENAFEGGSIVTIDLTECTNLAEIKYQAFYDCNNLKKVYLAENIPLTTIGSEVFCNCYNLETMDLSKCADLVTIGSSAFCNCYNLETMDLTKCVNLTSIGGSAFNYCSRLETMDLSQCIKLTSIGTQAFSYCSRLKSIQIALENAQYASEDGVLYNKDKTRLLAYPAGKREQSIVLSVESIGEYAFEGASIEKLDLLECTKLKKIESYAFYNCHLKEISLLDSLNTIGYCAFEYVPLQAIYYYGTYRDYSKVNVSEWSYMFSRNPKFYCMKISFTLHPKSKNYVLPGEVQPITVTVSRGTDKNGNPAGTVSYQWYQSKEGLNEKGTLIPGATEATYIPQTEEGITYYYCEATNECNGYKYTVVSKAATIGIEYYMDCSEFEMYIQNVITKIQSGAYVENIKLKTYKSYVYACQYKIQEKKIESQEEIVAAMRKIFNMERNLTEKDQTGRVIIEKGSSENAGAEEGQPEDTKAEEGQPEDTKVEEGQPEDPKVEKEQSENPEAEEGQPENVELGKE
ncbi:Leucine rich repeat-containing protein [[Clostridium] polysaccharolyticum]|uniref:Leucine rich repeat-containing protein n=1 Tax=[Clostridium] polysaccharolyticum TaxID=29364 RepID=A0A1I0EGP8_9FIRM|nr:Leucine rich repeat-containing protein [[Clostridium] polysaccharolyticum]